jgi:hypothetical protein
MRSKDRRASIAAAIALLERAHGKPQLTVDANVQHRFAVVPEVMAEELWLARRGQPVINGKATAVCPDAPTTLDRTSSDEDDPSKLN